MTRPFNLRGLSIVFRLDNRVYRGSVVTRIRGSRWMVEANTLPDRYLRPNGKKRIILDESQFMFKIH
jgi:hypothetical protein